MSTASNVSRVYKSVVDDVINNVKEAFLDEGVDEQVLVELRQLWDSKLQASKALDSQTGDSDIVYTNPNIAVLQQQANQAHRIMASTQVAHQIPVPIQLTTSGGTDLTGSAAAATMALPGGLFQHQLTALNTGNLTLHPAGNGHFYAVHPVQQGAPQVASTSITLPQQATLVQSQPMVQMTGATAAQQPQVANRTVQGMLQLDGAADTSSSEDDDFENDDNDDENEEEQNEEDAEAQGEEEEPLNSDDDVTDEDPSDLFDTENVVVCQYDKINRNKNKWKFHLKDGIMNLNGRDFVFQRANGDAEW